MADAFFDRFAKQVAAMAPAAEAIEGEAASVGSMPPGTASRAGDHPPPTGAVPHAAPSAAPAPPPSAVSLWALVPREPFGLPLAFWIGGGVFVLLFLIALGSLL
jgi:hypothetical protein